MISYHFDITSCSACSNCSTEDCLPSHQKYHETCMLHSALMYFDVYLVCLHICVSATFCHPPLSFCWEQRTFRLCAGQSSKLLFVFLRWGKGKNTTQQTSKNMHNLMPCSSQQVFKLKKSILRFKVCCRNTPARCDYIEAPGESAKESDLTQDIQATDPETAVSWQAGPKVDQAKRQKWQSALALARAGLL